MSKYLLKVFVDEDLEKIGFESVEFTNPHEVGLREYYNIIKCETIDVVNFDKYHIVIDDEGLLKQGNHVFQLVAHEGIMHLAGSLLIGKQKVTNDGIETTCFGSIDEVNELIDLLVENELSVIGQTN